MDDGTTEVADEYEQNVTAAIRRMRSNGYEFQQIVMALRNLGIVGRTGKPLGKTRVFGSSMAPAGDHLRRSTAREGERADLTLCGIHVSYRILVLMAFVCLALRLKTR